MYNGYLRFGPVTSDGATAALSLRDALKDQQSFIFEPKRRVEVLIAISHILELSHLDTYQEVQSDGSVLDKALTQDEQALVDCAMRTESCRYCSRSFLEHVSTSGSVCVGIRFCPECNHHVPGWCAHGNPPKCPLCRKVLSLIICDQCGDYLQPVEELGVDALEKPIEHWRQTSCHCATCKAVTNFNRIQYNPPEAGLLGIAAAVACMASLLALVAESALLAPVGIALSVLWVPFLVTCLGIGAVHILSGKVWNPFQMRETIDEINTFRSLPPTSRLRRVYMQVLMSSLHATIAVIGLILAFVLFGMLSH